MRTSIRSARSAALVLFAVGLAGYARAGGYGTNDVGPSTGLNSAPIFSDDNSSLSGAPPLAFSTGDSSYVIYNGHYYYPPAGASTDRVQSIDGFNCDTLFYTTVDSSGFVTARTAVFAGPTDLFGSAPDGWETATEKLLPQHSSFGASAGDPIATLDYINSSGIYQGALYSTVTGSTTNMNTNSLGVFAGPISKDFVSSFHAFFYDPVHGYIYQDELHFGLTDLNPTPIPLSPNFFSAELNAIDGSTAVGSTGFINADLTYLPEVPAYWTLDLLGHHVSDLVRLPNNGSLGTANSVNANGDIVGTLNGKAVLWKKDATGAYQLIDLNTLISPDSGWVLDFGQTILDDGTIFGVGTDNGQSAVFELSTTPTPEPTSICLLIPAAALLRKRVRSR